MKYDLKRLKEAIDGQIPEIHPDIELLHQAMQRTARRRESQTARVLTAAAACMLLLVVLGSLFAPGMQVRPDDTGDGRFALSQGGAAFPRASAAPQAEPPASAVVWEEDMDSYEPYSPLFAKSVFPDEAEFGDVVIRKIEHGSEKVFAFYDRVTGERIFEGENLWFYGQAFAYFPVSDTALVGNGEGMALVARDGKLITEYVYSHFEYLGGGAAIAAENGEDETVPSPMFVVSTADGRRLSGEYAMIGTLRTGEHSFLKGYADYDLTYDFDLMKADGSLIARLSGFEGVYLDGWLCVSLPGETDYCLMDEAGNVQLDGMRFSRVLGERDGMMIVRPVNEGWGVISRTGEWVFEPGEYLYVEMGPEDTFVVTDNQTLERRQVNAQGEEVTSLGMRIRWAIDRAEENFLDWLASFGKLGRAVLTALAGYLIIRLLRARSEGELKRMLATELGWALYAAALVLFSHRDNYDMQLWPTDTSTDGAYAAAWWFALASCGCLAAMIAAFPRLRRPGRAFFAGAAAMLIPWLWKMFASDMSVADWRTASALIFGALPVLALVLYRARFVRGYMDWCCSLDAQSEYARGWRMVWYILAAAALVNFCAGCWLSGQEMISLTHQTDARRGVVRTFDEEWIDGVNALLGEYVQAGKSEELLEERMKEVGWSQTVAVRWMDEQGIEELDASMLVSVTLNAQLQLGRDADPSLYLAGGSDSVPMIEFWPGISADDFGCTGVWLLPPGGELPAITGGVYVRQRESEWIASQHVWYIDMGQVAGGTNDRAEDAQGSV